MPRAEPTSGRIFGFSKFPLRCPHCEKRLKQDSIVLHGGALRCQGCERLQYVLPILHVGMAFVCDITSQEIMVLAQRGASPHEVLESLGFGARDAW